MHALCLLSFKVYCSEIRVHFQLHLSRLKFTPSITVLGKLIEVSVRSKAICQTLSYWLFICSRIAFLRLSV